MDKNKIAAEHIGDELHNAATNIMNEVYLMLDAREQATIDEVLEIIDDVYAMWSDNKIDTVWEVIAELNGKILALKGGE